MAKFQKSDKGDSLVLLNKNGYIEQLSETVTFTFSY